MNDWFEQIGIKREVPLSTRCADFYLLESLVNQGRRIAWFDADRKPIYEFSAPPDSPLELRQIAAAKNFDSLVNDMYDEFRMYLYYAGTGELCYIHNPDGTQQTRNYDYCPDHEEDKGEWSICGSTEEYWCRCNQECHCDTGAEDYDSDDCTCTEDYDNCTWEEEYCECCHCSDNLTWDEDGDGYCTCGSTSSPSIFEPEQAEMLGEIKRGAWGEQRVIDLAAGLEPGQVAEWIADAFENGGWSAGYGGERWALPYRLMADAERGNISKTTFIDRLWSIQHNGGSIFDKVYNVSSHCYECNWGNNCSDVHAPSLISVLQRQEQNDYDYLARHANYGGLWHETKRLLRRMGDLRIIRPNPMMGGS